VRVHELAQELGVSSKDIIARLNALGVEAKSQMSSVEDDAVALLIEEHKAGGLPPAPPPSAARPRAPVPAAKPPAPAAKPPVPAKPAAPVAAPAPLPAPAPAAAVPSAPVRPPAPASMPAPPAAPSPAAAPAAAPARPHAPEAEAGLSVEGRVVRARGPIVVKELADALKLKPAELIAELMGQNILASIHERIDIAAAKRVAQKHGFTLEHVKRGAEHRPPLPRRVEADVEEKEDRPEDLLPRPPVVTFLGHVDHGKTSLLDRIRNTRVVDSESGGITQHIGAYTVESGGRQICFLDTPGHAAFTAMRARGANLTDIAVIIIAADDGVMPQTEEAVSHAKAAGVSMLVAINKIDLPSAVVDRVKQQLQQLGMTPEDWGGDTICCPVSAQTGQGIDHLLEMILLQADVLELKANPARRASGFVIEAQLEPGMGPTVNLLVTRGTLKLGDAVCCGAQWGRVRALINDHGRKVKSATPSTPVKCLGLSGVPAAGEAFRVCASDRAARAAAEEVARRQKAAQVAPPRQQASLADLYERMSAGEQLQLNVVLKTDTQGSAEAILHALGEIQSAKIRLNVVLSGTGNITENDVLLASASQAVVLGFHVAKTPGVDGLAKREGVEIRLHSIIYELLDQVRDAMTGLLPPVIKERILGVAEIKQIFQLSRGGVVAGCLVASGTVTPRHRARVRRGVEVLYEGAVASLRHFHDEVSEVRQSQECGVRLDNFTAFAPGDKIEFYELEETRQTL